MDNPSTSARTPTALFWLAGLVVALGLAALVCASLPCNWLDRLGERAGHADDVTPERITRLRLLGVGLAMAHGLLAGLLLTWGRAVAEQFLVDLRREIVSASPLAGMRRAKEWVIQSGWLHIAALLIVLATAVAVRLKYLDVPMDYDEAYSFLNYASRPLYQGLADYNSTNNHLLNTLLMHVGFHLFGPLEWALRLHVFVAGVGLVGSAYLLGQRMLDAETGLVAAAVVAVSYVTVNYSVNARGYIWAAWMVVLLTQTSWRMAGDAARPRAIDWLVAAVWAVIGLFAIPTMLYAVFGCCGWLTIRLARLPGRAWGYPDTWILFVGLAMTWLYAPAFVFQGFSAWSHPFVAPQPFTEWVTQISAAWFLALKSWAEGPAPWFVAMPMFFAGLVVLGLRYRRALGLIASILLATFLIMALQRVNPPPRVFSFLSPLFALVVACGTVALCRLVFHPEWFSAPGKPAGQAGAVCSIIATGLCVWAWLDCRRAELPGGLRPTFLVEDVRELWPSQTANNVKPAANQLWRLSVLEAVTTLEPQLQPTDRVLVGLPADLPFHFYATRRGWTTPIGGQPRPGERLFLVLRGDEDPRTALRENLSLRFTDPWILQAKWQLLASGELAIWLARPVEAEARESDSN